MTTVRAVFGAVDIGASGGRVMAGIVEGSDHAAHRVRLEVVHRFGNRVSERDGSLFWDIRGLFDQVLTGLGKLAGSYPDVVSIGIDTWAVDYALLDADGELVADPYAYRDDRTAAVIDSVHAAMPPEELYAITGLQFLPFNTIYQLAAEKLGERWQRASAALLLPDLLAYWLTGVQRSEATNASTTGLFDAARHDWSTLVLDRVGIPSTLFPPVSAAGSVTGSLLPGIVSRTGLSRSTLVTAVGSHDTASAVVAVPAEQPGFAYISSGTWSLVGVELEQPILTEASREANFTNEGGVDNRIRYLRNAGGLWLLTESIREWESDGPPVDLADLLTAAEQVRPGGPLVDVDAEEFIAPGRMPQRIAAACERSGQPVPQTRAELVRCVLDSLAHAYADIVQQAGRLSGREIDVVHVVGGGSQNALLCQLTADRCGLPVVAGPVEATALGNVLVQARTHGAVAGTLEDLRELVVRSYDLTHYAPQESAVRS
ncbi:rhamnulokinase family protein [Microlunatus panaciterrae]|uniref:Rhamnulokinase n=1 Tax=Microlunatus panaciterrae TaxID=400768 RepID=A0ABS2RLK1_9ACTN|nr:rhamnulokinase [Microlunatus panaciterrae]